MANTRQTLKDIRSVRLTIWVAWMAYATITIGRYVFSASLGSLIAGGVYTETQMGMVSATFMLLYGFGQFLSGLIADRFNPLGLILLSLFVSALANLYLPFTTSFTAFYITWSINALFQSLAWPSLARLFSDRLNLRDCTRACVSMSSASIFGMIAAYGCTSLVTHLIGWQSAYLLSGGVLVVLCLIWLWFINKQKQFETQAENELPMESSQNEKSAATPAALKRNLIVTALITIALGCFFHGALKDGISTWTPVYLSQTAQIPAEISSALTMAVPAISLAGIYLVKWLSDKRPLNELSLCAVSFAGALVAIFCLGFINQSMILSLLLLACVSSVMAGINTVYLILIPNHFRKIGKISTATGLLNAVTYLGSGLGSFTYGALSQSIGWAALRLVWGGIAAAGILVCLLGRSRWKALTDTLLSK